MFGQVGKAGILAMFPRMLFGTQLRRGLRSRGTPCGGMTFGGRSEGRPETPAHASISEYGLRKRPECGGRLVFNLTRIHRGGRLLKGTSNRVGSRQQAGIFAGHR